MDSIVFVLAILFGIWTFSEGENDPVHSSLLAFDFVSGMALCLTLWFRRWWPVQLALVAAVVSIYSEAASGAALVLIMTVAIHKPSMSFARAINRSRPAAREARPLTNG